MQSTSGTLKGIAHRPVDGKPMQEAAMANVVPGRGIDTENRKTGRREITLISAQAWQRTCKDLGVQIPWHTRRANLLIDGVDLSQSLGRIIAIGPVTIRIHGETKPCGLMDAQQPGLRGALQPEFRGGVHGEVLTGGIIRIGDPVSIGDQ